MANLQFAVLFSAVDQLSNKLGAIGNAVSRFTDIVTVGSERVHSMGQRMVEWGEKIAVATAVLSEGADRLHEWSQALSEPAFAMQQSMATMVAMTGLGGNALDKIKERAAAFANTHPGVTAEQWVAGLTRMRGIFQDTMRAIAAEDTAAMLSRFGVDGSAAANLLAASWTNLRSLAQQTGDALMRTIQLFGLAPDSAQQLALAIGRLGGTGAQTNTTLPELLSLLGQATQQFGGGGRGAMMFDSMIRDVVQKSAEGKGAIDWSHGLAQGLAHIRAEIVRLAPADRLPALGKMGATDRAAMATFLNHLDTVAGKQKQIADNAGTLSKAYGTATRNAADATALLHQNISNLYDAIYSPALSTITGWLADLTGVAQTASAATGRHSTIARYAAPSLTALGGGAYYSLRGLAALGTMTAFAGKGVQALSTLLDVQSHYLRVLYAWDRITNIATAVKGFGGSLVSAIPSIARFGAILYVNPLTWYIAGAVALGAAAYEIYKHWDVIAPFFERLWARLKGIFTDAADWLKTAGPNMMKSLGEGILTGVEYPFKAPWQVAEKVGGLFHFHSPPDYGPLRDAVLNFRFGEELGARIQPAPVVGAASKMAAGIAAPVVRAEPTGQASAGRAGAGNTIHIHYSPHINVTGGPSAKDEWVKAARQHADELVRIIRGKLQREARLSFT
jgi:hypothetical protein